MSLSKLIPAVKDAESAFNELNKLVAVSEQNAGDLISNWDRFKASLGDVEENLGKALDNGDSIVLQLFQERVDQLNTDLANNENGLAGVLGIVAENAFLNVTTFGQMATGVEILDRWINGTTEDLKKLNEEFVATPFIGAPFQLPPESPFKDKPKPGKDPFSEEARQKALTGEGGSFGGFTIASFLSQGSEDSDPFKAGFLEEQEAIEERRKENEKEALDEHILVVNRWVAENERVGKELRAIDAKSLADKQNFYNSMGQTIGQGLGSMIGAIQQGEAGVGQALAGLFNSLIGLIVPKLFGMAQATEASGVAASTIGTPAAIFSGVLLAGAAAAFAALGSSGRRSLATRGNTALAAARAGRAPTFAATTTTGGGFGTLPPITSIAFQGGTRSHGPTVVNVQFGSGPAILGGDPARIARDVQRFLENFGRATRPGAGR